MAAPLAPEALAPDGARRRGSARYGATSLTVMAFNGAAQALLAATYLLTARTSGPETFGWLVSAVALASAVAGIVDFGQGTYLIRELARGTITPEHALARVATTVTGLLLVGTLTALVGVLLFPGRAALALIALLPAALAAGTSVPVLLSGRGRPVLAAAIDLSGRTTALTVLLLLGRAGTDVSVAFPAALLSGHLIAATAALVAHRPVLSQLRRRWPANPFRGSSGFGFSVLFLNVQRLDVVLLTVVAGPAVGGIFGAVSRCATPLTTLTGAFLQSSRPHMAGAATGRAAARAVLANGWALVPAWAVMGATALASPFLVGHLLGTAYADSAPVLSVLALGMIFWSLCQVMLALYQSRGGEHRCARLIGVAAAAQLLAVAGGGLLSGPLGAGWGVVGAQLLLLVLLARLGLSLSRGSRPGAGVR